MDSNTLIVLLTLLAVASAAPQLHPKDAVVLEQYNFNDNLRTWKWGFRTSNGIERMESRTIKEKDTPEEAPEVTGSYSWTAPNGVTFKVNYVASKNGFAVKGRDTPQPKMFGARMGSQETVGEDLMPRLGLCSNALASLACG